MTANQDPINQSIRHGDNKKGGDPKKIERKKTWEKSKENQELDTKMRNGSKEQDTFERSKQKNSTRLFPRPISKIINDFPSRVKFFLDSGFSCSQFHSKSQPSPIYEFSRRNIVIFFYPWLAIDRRGRV